MTSDEIRETYLRYFEERGHLRVASASLVPPPSDRSVLFTVAGMQPFKPYFLGQETPPSRRLTSCQKVFRTVDIDQVGLTSRHLTNFEMLGNFSIGDYFKRGAVEYAWELSQEGFGLSPDDIWVTVFEGDEELGLGPDEEAIEAWMAVGVPRRRIVACPRSENFWQGGPTGPSGPCSELYFDRGLAFGAAEDLPGGDNERFLEYWNLVFMQFNQDPPNHLEPLPASNIDTGLGLNRLAAMLQDVPSVFETDQFRPLIELGEQLSGRRYGEEFSTDRALRILADHSRGASFLVADGVVPSNEERGYVLRRIMRRAIQQGRTLGLAPGFLPRYADVVEEVMGSAYPELREQRDPIRKWLASEEESFGRTLEQGTRQLRELIERAQASGASLVSAHDAFTLHDTFGFPFDLTKELLAEHGLQVQEEGFAELMEQQRARARAAGSSGAGAAPDTRERVRTFAEHAASTTFTGYETERQATTVGAVEPLSGDGDRSRVLVKLSESPFYAAGGGQVSDVGTIECEHGDCRGAGRRGVSRRRRSGARGRRRARRAAARRACRRARRSRRAARHRGQPHGDAPPARGAARPPRQPRAPGRLLRGTGQAALRLQSRRGAAATRSCATSRTRSTSGSCATTRSARSPPPSRRPSASERWRCSVRSTATWCAWCRSATATTRASCAAARTWPRRRRSACCGSSARPPVPLTCARIEAVTGPAAVGLLRHHDDLLREVSATLRTSPEQAPAVVSEREQRAARARAAPA